MISLEGIRFSEVLNESGVRYDAFRKMLNARYSVVWRDISIGYALLIGTVTAFLLLESRLGIQSVTLFVLPFAALLTAFWIAYLQLFVHEAAHYNIHPDKKKNDLLANIFLCSLLGVHIKSYRLTHAKHHVRLGMPDDTEHSYFNRLTFPLILRLLSGLHVMYILKSRNTVQNGQTEESLRLSRRALIVGAVLNVTLLSVLLALGFWLTALLWVAAVLVFYPFFATLRQILEHRGEEYQTDINFFEVPHGKNSRIFKTGLFTFFLGGAGFDRHLLHHWDPAISYTRLKDVEEFLMQTEKCGSLVSASKQSYFEAFAKLTRITK